MLRTILGKLGGRFRGLRRRVFRVTAAGFVILGVPAIAGLFTPPRVTFHNVPVRNLPRELDGFTVAQLSDIHCSRIVPKGLIRSAVKLANDSKPDIVVVTGDFVSRNAKASKPCAEMLSHLKSRLGTYAVLGNHDHWTDPDTVQANLELKGIKVLVNENTEVAPGLVILGVDDYWAGKPDIIKTWKGVSPKSANILLSHNPVFVRSIKNKDCLMLSGHNHGIETRIDFAPHSSIPCLGQRIYPKGWYREGNIRLYVNRGIGFGFGTLVFRRFVPPEVSVFKLRCVKK